MTLVDRIWQRCRLATLSPAGPGLGLIDDGLIAATDGRIVYAGLAADAPSALDAKERIDCAGRWITPGLIDCHTHLVYGGNRAHEFEQRLMGASYEEIARAGGGIVSTVKATRQASTDALIAEALPRLDALIAEGVTTIEIKSGYGLELDTERRQLQAARRLGTERAVSVQTTFLGAHSVAPEMGGDKAGYIDAVCNAMLPAIAAEGLADTVDAFCEGIAFSVQQTAQVFATARALGLPVRLHADQLSNLHGAALAARFGARSADHLEYADDDGIAAMAGAGTVAVLLPGAFYFIRETQLPPIEAMRRHGVRIALATDCNPGTSPLTSLLLTMNMGATLFRLTVDECIAAVTREAARALGLFERTGSLEACKACDLAIWDIERPAELVYRMGFNPLHARVWRGAPQTFPLRS
jgi:imidazolonepropionase